MPKSPPDVGSLSFGLHGNFPGDAEKLLRARLLAQKLVVEGAAPESETSDGGCPPLIQEIINVFEILPFAGRASLAMDVGDEPSLRAFFLKRQDTPGSREQLKIGIASRPPIRACQKRAAAGCD